MQINSTPPLEAKTSPQPSKSTLRPDLPLNAYRFSTVSQDFVRLIPPRRNPFPTLPNIWVDDKEIAASREECERIGDDLFNYADLPEYAECSTFERAHPVRRAWGKRPITHAFELNSQAALIDLFDRLGPGFYKWILGHIEPPMQAYDNASRIGAPEYSIVDRKLLAIWPYFIKLMDGDLSMFDRDDVFIINNIRLQAEPKAKEREFMFVSKDNLAYLENVGPRERYDQVYKRYCSRIRLVFNYPLANLLTQVLDTAIHNLFISHPAYHHNMMSWIGRTLPGHVVFIDCKHFERSVGGVVRRRAQLIGGLYGEIMSKLLNSPYLVPTDGGDVVGMRINQQGGFVEQLGSGISSVAPISKEILTLCYADFVMKYFGQTFEQAVNTVIGGGNNRLAIMNYGDDNIIYGEEEAVRYCFAHLQKFLTVEEEVPPKFLGVYYDPEKGFRYGRRSYLSNWYLAERPPRSRFRPYPVLGFELRRELFARHGESFISEKLIPYETELLTKLGYTASLMRDEAQEERKRLSSETLDISEKVLLGKEYMLTEEEKATDIRFDVLGKGITRRIIETLLKGRKNA